MSAARNIPFEHPDVAYNIPIGAGLIPTGSNPGLKLGVSQPITFTNNSGAEIGSIVFQANPPLPAPNAGPILYPNTITDLANGATSAELSPTSAQGSVNYFIYDTDGNPYGPYSIQLGNTVPLMIAMLALQAYPETAAIPAQGIAAIYSADQPCVQYDITWTQGNPFTQATGSAACGYSNSAIRTGITTENTYSYKFVNPANNPGGGKIIIQG